mmetsp:Transcript_39415/g.70661  ORF Transcript_39415/g.70661 Transcript_39415/m.70661 type:complete len:122 (+) Transcript_39415:1207-1572(+)
MSTITNITNSMKRISVLRSAVASPRERRTARRSPAASSREDHRCTGLVSSDKAQWTLMLMSGLIDIGCTLRQKLTWLECTVRELITGSTQSQTEAIVEQSNIPHQTTPRSQNCPSPWPATT